MMFYRKEKIKIFAPLASFTVRTLKPQRRPFGRRWWGAVASFIT